MGKELTALGRAHVAAASEDMKRRKKKKTPSAASDEGSAGAWLLAIVCTAACVGIPLWLAATKSDPRPPPLRCGSDLKYGPDVREHPTHGLHILSAGESSVCPSGAGDPRALVPGSGAKAESFAAQVFVDALDLGGDKAPIVEIPCSAASDGEVNDWLLVYLQRLIGVERPSLLRRLQQEAAPPSASEEDVERWEFFTPCATTPLALSHDILWIQPITVAVRCAGRAKSSPRTRSRSSELSRCAGWSTCQRRANSLRGHDECKPAVLLRPLWTGSPGRWPAA